MFSFLSNIGATLCFGTTANKHIGMHALNYDSCPDGYNCNFIKSRSAFSDAKSKFNYSNFQMDLNKVLVSSYAKNLSFNAYSYICYDLTFFQEKYCKINWDIYDKYNIKTHLIKLENVVLII